MAEKSWIKRDPDPLPWPKGMIGTLRYKETFERRELEAINTNTHCPWPPHIQIFFMLYVMVCNEDDMKKPAEREIGFH